jgi:hypothetical protein
MFDQLNDYLKYSGITVTITFNPYHWRFLPEYEKESADWDISTNRISFLFLTIRFWLSNGDY